MQTPDSIQSYEAYIQLQPLPGKRRIASTNTRRAYIRDLTLFARWFHDSIERPFTPANITREDIQDYIAHLRTVQDAAVSTIQRKYASIRSFCEWAVAAGLAQYNESEGVSLPRAAISPRGS